jgi:hypothetical protein
MRKQKYSTDEERHQAKTDAQRRYRENNREKKRQSGRDWYRKQGLDVKRRMLLKKWYGITIEDYADLLEKQNGLCAICGENRNPVHKNGTEWSLCVDHNHDTGKVRGLLCGKCNTAIGMMDDRLDLVLKAADYLMQQER